MKYHKFINFVIIILAARQVSEEDSLEIVSQAFEVTEKELNNKNAFSEKNPPRNLLIGELIY